MSGSRISGGSPRKSRGRPVAAETVALMDTLAAILAEQHPMSSRGAFYAATVAGAVEKTEAGYSKVQRLLVRMRERGQIPWAWISDGTRWRRGVTTYAGPDEALQDIARLYRKDLWRSADEIVEIWLEKEALAGVLMPVVSRWAVDLMVCRGYPSLSYLRSAAEDTIEAAKPLVIYYLGDHDPSGKDIPRTIARRLDDWHVDFELVQLAVSARQIDEWGLPTRPTKKTDTRAAKFNGDSVELDAIPAARLRALVDDAIRGHIDEHQVRVLEAVEAEERELLFRLAGEVAA
jgi:hypothetical protein